MEKIEEKISIIIPVYKVEKYLDKCIESVVNQTYSNLEIILVDDGSPDNCPKICENWQKKDKRIVVIHKQNGGLSDARNFGLDKATGDFIMFLDSDDYVNVNICKELLALLKKYNADIAMCQAKYIYEDEQSQDGNKVHLEENTEKEFTKNQLFKLAISSEIPLFMTAWGKLYKKHIFESLRYDVGKIHEDEFILHKIIAQTDKLVYTTKKMYYYLQRSNSIMGTKTSKSYQHSLEALTNRIDYYIKNGIHEDDAIRWIANFTRNNYLKMRRTKIDKKIQSDYLLSFKRYYKLLKNKTKNDRIFYFSPTTYYLLYNIKHNKQKHSSQD